MLFFTGIISSAYATHWFLSSTLGPFSGVSRIVLTQDTYHIENCSISQYSASLIRPQYVENRVTYLPIAFYSEMCFTIQASHGVYHSIAWCLSCIPYLISS